MTATQPGTSDAAATWYVLGAGAMGCLWAAHLSLQGTPVRLLLRDEAALRRYQRAGGVRLSSADMAAHKLPLAAGLASAAGAPITRLLLATKAQHAAAALAAVQPRLSRRATVLMLQNGLAVQQQLTDELGTNAFCLSTNHGAWLRGDFEVVRAGAGRAWLGSLLPAPDMARLQRLRAELPWQHLAVAVDLDMRERLWRKLAINCAVNALTVVHDCRNGDLLQISAARRQLSSLCEEIEAICEQLPAAPSLAPLWPQVQDVLQQTASNVSSTLQDARRGRATELDHLNGWLCQQAQAAAVDCQHNRQVLLQAQRLLAARH